MPTSSNRYVAAFLLVIIFLASCRQERSEVGQEVVSLAGGDSIFVAILGTVTGMFVKGDTLFLLDGASKKIILADKQGRIVQEIGREGQGPGEFIYPSSLSSVESGQLIVSDPVLSRISFFRVAPGAGYTYQSQVATEARAPVTELTFDPHEKAIYGFRERDSLFAQYGLDGSFQREFFPMRQEHYRSRENDGTLHHVQPKAVLAVDQDALYAVYNIDPTIYKLSREAVVIDSFEVDLPHFKRSKTRPLFVLQTTSQPTIRRIPSCGGSSKAVPRF